LYLKYLNPIYIIEGTLTTQTTKAIIKAASISIKRIPIPFFFISFTPQKLIHIRLTSLSSVNEFYAQL